MSDQIKIVYSLYNPTGNVTCLVETFVPTESQPIVAKFIMKHESSVQQVGFVSLLDDGIALRMAGGEFCGNAAMCAAVHYLQHVHPELEEGKVNVYFPGISDIVDPVVVEVSQQTDETWEGCVSMPLPLSINFERLSFGAKVPVVRFPGIVHVLMDYDSLKIDKNMSIGYFKDMAVDLGKKYKSSLGLIFYKLEDLLVQPLVYVPAVDSVILESSCASGVAAIGAFQAERLQQPVDYTFYFQNTAPLTVHAVHDVELQLTGKLEVKKRSVSIPFLL